jgi:hypothetical protein
MDWHAWLEDDENGDVCIYIQQGSETGTRELRGKVGSEDAENEMLNNEDELLAAAEAEAENRNLRSG